jgi:hypothetical protein
MGCTLVDKNLPNSKKELKITDFSDFTILEFIILQSLSNHNEPIIRHVLYQEVNQIIYPNQTQLNEKQTEMEKINAEQLFSQSLLPKKELSTSSFYNSLNTLSNFGLIKLNLNKKGKVDSVIATPLAKISLLTVNRHFLSNLIDEENAEIKVIPKLMSRLSKTRFESILSIWFQKRLDSKIISSLQSFTRELYMLSFETVKDEFKAKYKEISFSSMHKGLIREPNDLFEAIILPDYQKIFNLQDISKESFFHELVRIIKSEGWIITIVRSKVQNCNIAGPNLLFELYNQIQTEKGRIFSKEELIRDLESMGLLNPTIIEEDGLIITINQIKKP